MLVSSVSYSSKIDGSPVTQQTDSDRHRSQKYPKSHLFHVRLTKVPTGTRRLFVVFKSKTRRLDRRTGVTKSGRDRTSTPKWSLGWEREVLGQTEDGGSWTVRSVGTTGPTNTTPHGRVSSPRREWG